MKITKVCLNCKKDYEVLYKYRSQKYCSQKCRISHGKVAGTKHWIQQGAKRKYKGLKSRNIGVCLQSEFIDWFNKSLRICEYCGIKEEDWSKIIDPKVNIGKRWLTIDRKDNDIGYQIDNISWCCMRCNQVKNSVLTYQEMKEIGIKYIRVKWLKEIKEIQNDRI